MERNTGNAGNNEIHEKIFPVKIGSQSDVVW